MRIHIEIAIAGALLLPSVSLGRQLEANEQPPAGHSYHGETFNEGPRQAAYILGSTGIVDFPITTSFDEAREFFNQGVGQLHGFWYFEAERSFRQAASVDPDCAMLYWGMAMANENNDDRAKGFIAEAMNRLDFASVRERMYIEALDGLLNGGGSSKSRRKQYLQDLEALCTAYPDDVEAKAFRALAHYQFSQRGVKIESHEDVNDIIEEVLGVNPRHPVHHYAIHLWDYKDASRALHSAAMCGPSSPGIAHMWHMPGHIYWQLHRYADSAWQQEASARVDHAHMMRDGLLPDQIFNFAHNNEWLIRSLMYVGRIHDALNLATNMIDLPRHPSYNTLKGQGSAKYGRMRLMDVLSKFEMWREVLALAETSALEPTDLPSEQVKRLKLVGVAQYMTGDIAGGDASLAAVETLAGLGAERISREAIKELRAVQAFANGDAHAAAELYDDVRRTDRCRHALMHLEAGEFDEAVSTAKREVSRNDDRVRPLAVLAYVQFEAGQVEEAKETFEKLRAISAEVDLDVPAFERLTDLAATCGAPNDWRLPREDPGDLGDRPDLESLGPFRWEPTEADAWSLPTATGSRIALSDYRGRPVIVVFYLGFSCLHCVEQLQAFAPMADAFSEAGISVVAISTDSPSDLDKALVAYPEGDETAAFPFPLVSDASLDMFRRYGCYDDFEAIPLHGTFLIDGAGLIRWRDVSYEPFTDVEFLLEESERLLRQKLDR